MGSCLILAKTMVLLINGLLDTRVNVVLCYDSQTGIYAGQSYNVYSLILNMN